MSETENNTPLQSPLSGGKENGVKLPVMEHFYTIQGEGAHTGVPAYFIRLGGCDVGCVWCDVKDSWDTDAHPQHTVQEIAGFVQNHPKIKHVVITGGEPAMYDLAPLTDELHKHNYQIHIETSGAYELTGNIDWVTVSPKKFKAPLPSALVKAHELKVIIYNKSDFDWAEKHAQHVSSGCRLLLQPEWSKRKKVSPLIVEYVKEYPKWNISLQTHKYLGVD